MLENLLLNAVEITLGASAVILLLLFLQPLTAKFFKRKWRYWAWLILAVRLLLPFTFSFDSVVEFTVPQNEIVLTSPVDTTVTPPSTSVDTTPVMPALPENPDPTPNVIVRPAGSAVTGSGEKAVPVLKVMAIVWLLVAAVLFIFKIVSHTLFSKSTCRFNREVEDEGLNTAFEQLLGEMNIKTRVKLYRNAKIKSPLLIGFFNPKVLLPKTTATLEGDVMILRHELMHLKRGDLYYKLLMQLCACVNWFNPLVWVMAKVSDSDLENACDEDVVKNRTEDFRHNYCESILKVVRAQKSREPVLAAGFSSRPSEIKRRFIRILDMTKKRGGKVALVGLMCLSILCTVFVGCNLGSMADAVLPSPEDEKVPFSVKAEIERQLSIPLSKDPEMMASLTQKYSYSEMEIIFEDTRSRDIEIEYVEAGYVETRSEVHKTSLYKLTTNAGEKLVLMNTEKSYIYENGLIVSQTVDYITYTEEFTSALSATDFSGAELVMSDDCSAYGVYVPQNGSMLMNLNDTYKLVEVLNQDKNDPLLFNWLQSYPVSYYADSLADEIVFATKKNGETYLVYYDESEKNIISFIDIPVGNFDNHNFVTLLSSQEGTICVCCKSAILFFDLNSGDPFTPISVIDKDDIGKDFMAFKMAQPDRNNSDRFVIAYKGDDNMLGFVSFDTFGNYANSFDLDGMYIYSESDLNYQPVFVDNIVYFTHISKGYFTREYRKYAVDVRAGTGNRPTLQKEEIIDDNNVPLEKIDYSRDSNAFPFELDGKVKVMMMYESLSIGGKDGKLFNYNINGVSYDAKTTNVSATSSKITSTLSGKLEFIGDSLYFTPNNYEYLPRPYDKNTKKVMPVLISTTDKEALKDYVNSLNLDMDNVVISIKNLIIQRVDGVLSYTAEIKELFSDDSDYVTRQNQALDILKIYGALSDGEYSITPSEIYADEYVLNVPEMRTSPLGLLNYNGFNNTSDLVGWYAMFNMYDEIEQLSFTQVRHKRGHFQRAFEFERDEFESVITKYFDISVDTLRASECYDYETNTYRADYTDYIDETIPLKVSHLEFTRFGDVMQIIIHSNSTDTYHHIFVKLNADGSYKFLKGSSDFYGYETPSILVTNLTE